MGPRTSMRASGEEESVGGEISRVEDWGMSIVGDEGVAWIWRKRRAIRLRCNLRPEAWCLRRWLEVVGKIAICCRMAGTLRGLMLFFTIVDQHFGSASTMGGQSYLRKPAGVRFSFIVPDSSLHFVYSIQPSLPYLLLIPEFNKIRGPR